MKQEFIEENSTEHIDYDSQGHGSQEIEFSTAKTEYVPEQIEYNNQQEYNIQIADNPIEDNQRQTGEFEEYSSSNNVKRKRKQPTYEETLLEILRESRSDENDEDKLFLMSLLPSFKKLTADQKFNVRIEFLQTLQRVSFSNDTGPKC